MPELCPEEATVERLDLYRVRLPLRGSLRHASASTPELDEIFAVFTLASGIRGVAEVRGNGEYTTGQNAKSVIEDIRRSRDRIVGQSARSAATNVLDDTQNRLAAALLDAAALDATAVALRVPVWRYLGGSYRGGIPTHAPIGFANPGETAELARKAKTRGFRRVKVRVGSSSLDEDLERVSTVRSEIGPACELALDANGAWCAEAALGAIERLEPLEIRWIEQPTPADEEEALRFVRSHSPVPVLADEAVRDAEDVRRVVVTQLADGVHLKLEKCGTVEELHRAARLAREAGLLVELGQMDQGRTGTAMTAHIATVVEADFFELWGFHQVDADVASGVEIRDGKILLNDAAGLGVDVRLDEAYRVATLC
jgi:L-alanine-DL-glutamate epimerase-like enolase superfamily enzyme